MRLHGRAAEIGRVSAMIDNVHRSGDALLIRGDVGVGKSALLAEAGRLAQAAGLRTLHSVGVEAEYSLTYSGLHQLVWPLRDDLAVLAPAQRAALRAALGLGGEAEPDAALVRLAVLSLVTELARERPLAIVLDDAHWLDGTTVDVLAFACRRFRSERVVAIATVRNGFPTPWDTWGLPELTLPPLSLSCATALLVERNDELHPDVRERVLREAAGNPLALLELPDAIRDLGPGRMADRTWLPLTDRLERAFSMRLEALPALTRTMLRVAALNDSSDVGEAVAATSLLTTDTGITAAALLPAVEARTVEVTAGHITFCHPLTRSAILQGAGGEWRRSARRALADAVAGDEDRAAWHRARACDDRDEILADDMERVANRAQRRGNNADALAALDRAARLTPDVPGRVDRLLRAADLGVELAHHDVVSRLLGEAAALPLSDLQTAKYAWVRSAFESGLRDGEIDVARLVELAREISTGDVNLAVRVLWSAALRCFWSEPGVAARELVVELAEQLTLDPSDPRVVAILAFAAPIERGTVVLDRVTHSLRQARADPESNRLLASAALLVGELDVAMSRAGASVPGLRAYGGPQLLAGSLVTLAWSAAHVLDLDVAVPAAAEARELAGRIGQPFLQGLVVATQAKLAALCGDIDTAVALSTEAERLAVAVTARPVIATALHARALAALAAGDPDEALGRLLRLHDPREPSYHLALRCYTVPDLAEAAVRSGQPDLAAPAIAEMEQVAQQSASPSLHEGLRLARALLASASEAGTLFETALHAQPRCRPLVRARIELSYGEWLRRQRRTTEAREALRAARDVFDALGAVPWSERARHELRAAGAQGRSRPADATGRLTAQEHQIALLASEGLTNREIGQRLFISHRTVGGHLARTFVKLGVSSRGQLNHVLP